MKPSNSILFAIILLFSCFGTSCSDDVPDKKATTSGTSSGTTASTTSATTVASTSGTAIIGSGTFKIGNTDYHSDDVRCQLIGSSPTVGTYHIYSKANNNLATLGISLPGSVLGLIDTQVYQITTGSTPIGQGVSVSINDGNMYSFGIGEITAFKQGSTLNISFTDVPLKNESNTDTTLVSGVLSCD